MCCVFLEPKNFRLRRAYNKVVSKEFLRVQERTSAIRKNDLAFSHALLLVFSRVQDRASTIHKNDLAAAQPFLIFSRVYERASTIRKSDINSGSRADAGLGVFTGVGTYFCHLQKCLSSCDIYFINIIDRAGVEIARRRRNFFTISPSKHSENSVFDVVCGVFLNGYPSFW